MDWINSDLVNQAWKVTVDSLWIHKQRRILFVEFLHVQTYACHVSVRSHSVLIIIMFKEVKIQYTINLTLLWTSLFFFGMSIFRGIEKSKGKKSRAKQYLTLCHSRRIRVNAHCGLFVMDFSHHYDCYCYYDCRVLHIRRLRFLFWFIFNFIVGHFECIWLVLNWKSTHSHHHDGRHTGQCSGIWNPFFQFGCRIYRRVSKS